MDDLEKKILAALTQSVSFFETWIENGKVARRLDLNSKPVLDLIQLELSEAAAYRNVCESENVGVGSLSSHIAALKTDRNAMSNALTAVRQKHDQLASQIEDYKRTINDLQTQLRQRDEEIERASLQRLADTDQIKDLKAQLHSAKEDVYAMGAEHTPLVGSMLRMPLTFYTRSDEVMYERETIYERARRLNGDAYQWQKLAEECSELAVEALKLAQGRQHNLIGEIADVLYMLEMVALIYGPAFFTKALYSAFVTRDEKVSKKLDEIENGRQKNLSRF